MNLQVILAIHKNAKHLIKDEDIEKFAEWIRDKTDLNPFFDRIEVDFPIEFKDFNKKSPEGRDLFGTSGTKEKLRTIIPARTFHVVVFLYAPPKERMWNVTGWAFPNPVHFKDGYTEIPVHEDYKSAIWKHRALTHEILHLWHRLAWWNGVQTNDTMDQYDKEFEIEAPDGNRARNLAVLSRHSERIATAPIATGLMRVLLQALQLQIVFLKKKLLGIDSQTVQRGFKEFASHMRVRESSGNYGIKNAYGYLGAYQFGLARLSGFGMTTRVGAGSRNESFVWKAPHSEFGFLNDPQLQDEMFKKHVDDHKRSIKRLFTKQEIKEHTMSGLVAGAHLRGLGGIQNLVRGGDDFADANGTRVSNYVEEFAGYKI